MKLPRLALPLLLAAFVALALAYSMVIPLGEAPDEVSHWAYVQYLIAHHRLPKPEGAVLGESHQPPLYYALNALATFWIPQSDFQPIANPDFSFDNPATPNLLLHPQRENFPYRADALAWHLARLLSVAMGAITVWATWHIASVLLPNEAWLALGAAAFVAFLPEFTFISAVVNNDNGVIALTSLSVLQILRVAQRPWRARDAAILGALLGLAALTKLSGLVVWLFVALVFLFLAWRRGEWKRTLIHATLCFGVAGVIVAPWLMYNWANYGDPLGWSLVLAVTPLRRTPLTLNDLVYVIASGLYTSFWGRFGGALHLRMSDAIYIALGAWSLVALGGWVRWARERRHDLDARAPLAAFVVFWLLMLAAFARWTLAELGTDQARQLFPGLPLLALVLMIGLASWSAARQKTVLALSTMGMFALNLAVLFYLGATFAGSPQNLAALPRLGGANAPADFGHSIRVLDYRVEPTRVAPGGAIVVQIQWQALSATTENDWLLLQLVGAGNPIVNQDGVPANGNPTTDEWRAGQVFVSRHTLVVPNDATPGTYALRLGLHPFGRWEWLPVRGQDMLMLGNVTVVVQ